jgi:hypothetical protein
VNAPESAAQPERKKAPYVAPAVLWKHRYVALMQVSEPPCIPGMDPRCTP